MSNTLKQIEQRKRQLGDIKGQPEVVSAKAEPQLEVAAAKPALVGPQKPMPTAPKPDDKAATIAALQVRVLVCSKQECNFGRNYFRLPLSRPKLLPAWTRSVSRSRSRIVPLP